jgi:hypothetical protein
VHKSSKPIRKCHGCKLNLGETCGVFPNPREQWNNKTCHGFGNEKMYQEYIENKAKHPPDSAKEKRRESARFEKTEHVDLLLPEFRGNRRPSTTPKR